MPRKKLYKRKYRLKKGSYNTKPELQVKAILDRLTTSTTTTQTPQ